MNATFSPSGDNLGSITEIFSPEVESKQENGENKDSDDFQLFPSNKTYSCLDESSIDSS